VLASSTHASTTQARQPTQPVLDPPAFALLSRIDAHGPMRLSALAGTLYLDLSTISRQVHDLELAGWVVRERDAHDGRAHLLQLSDQGRQVLAAGQAQRADVLRQLLADWSEHDLQSLATQLSRFNDAVATYRAAVDARTHEPRTQARQETA
jgi:DNA-binding MarR family transcriptional regulator